MKCPRPGAYEEKRFIQLMAQEAESPAVRSSSVVVSYQLHDTMVDGGLEEGHGRGGEPLR